MSPRGAKIYPRWAEGPYTPDATSVVHHIREAFVGFDQPDLGFVPRALLANWLVVKTELRMVIQERAVKPASAELPTHTDKCKIRISAHDTDAVLVN